MVANRGAGNCVIGCFLKEEGTEMTDSTQNISRGVEGQKELFEEVTKEKKAKGGSEFAAGNRHVLT